MAYQDLIIALQPLANSERYRVITHSPTNGRVSAQFVSPFGDERIHTWRNGLAPREMRQIGALLYRRLFSPEICQAFQATQRFAERQGLALRLKLAIDSTLMQLPWEYLYNPDVGEFLCLEGRLALTRHFNAAPPRKPFDWSDLVIYYTSAADDATPDVDFLMRLAEKNGITTRRLALATLENDATALTHVQIWHVQTTGGRDPASGSYALRLSNRQPEQWLTPAKIARWLDPSAAILLGVIDGGTRATSDSYAASAVAAELVERQIIASAVTFQFPLDASLRKAFFQSFYRALSKQMGLDLAVSEGRRAIAEQGGIWEWGAPVLYSALPDDQPRPDADKFDAEYISAQAMTPDVKEKFW